MKRGALLASCLLAVWNVAAPVEATVVVEVSPDESRVDAIARAIGDETVRVLAGGPRGPVTIRVRADLPGAPRADALVEALLAPTYAALRAQADRHPSVEPTSVAGDGPVAAGRAGGVVFIDYHVRLAGHSLHVDATVWTRETTAPGARFDVRSRLDPELRAYVGGLARLTERTVTARSIDMPGRGYVALAVHDLNGDGANELAALTGTGVHVFRLGAGGTRLFRLGETSIPMEIGRAPAPTRRPLGTTSRAERALFARVSERAAPFRVELVNGVVRVARADDRCPSDMYPIDAGCAALAPGRDFFDDTLTTGIDPVRTRELDAHFYAHAERRVRTAEGDVVRFEAIVTPTGRLAVRIGPRTNAAVGYGTALAMSDLDDDASMELLLASTRLAGEGDQLTLARALPRGTLTVIWRSEILAGSVWIAAHGDLDGDGREELFAIEEPRRSGRARLWIVR